MPSTSSGAGFVISGRVVTGTAVKESRTREGDEPSIEIRQPTDKNDDLSQDRVSDHGENDVITLSSDEEDVYSHWTYDQQQQQEAEIELVRVLPKSKSRLLPAGQVPGGSDLPGVDCTYDSGSLFQVAFFGFFPLS